ncbi:carboxymuconolactone decarboxylase family protein [Agromyces sp. LHK192]|uniref:carboxymuconolactone decarboxylase family protein n=1 Tax=Agromyces sp. LHK192 TaxID=2498704 RepID=UPI000FDA2372|nr:carboxymuconolactone decarboxylase family protein [Agromyces sp. LHK192]
MTTAAAPTTASDRPAPAVVPTRRLDLDGVAPAFIRAVTALDEAADAEAERAGIPDVLRHLIRLRASQLNGCSYCVDLHSRDAVTAGEHVQRVYAVAVWPESNFFTARERAAFALTDDVTRLSETHVPEAVWNEASAHFSDDELAALLAVIVAINAWNALAVSTRGWRPRLQG